MRCVLVRFVVAIVFVIAGLLPTAHAAEQFSPEKIKVDGLEREYLIHLPKTHSKAAPGVILLLHGHLGNIHELVGQGHNRAAPYRNLLPIADRENLILVAAQGARGGDGKTGWNDCRGDADTNPATDDVKFLEDIIDRLVASVGADPKKVFVIGTSNGGMMALRMAIERPGRVAGVAAIVGAMPAKSKCAAPTKAVPVLLMNGTADPLLPWDGGPMGVGRGERGSVLSAEASIAVWRTLGGFDAVGKTEQLKDLDGSDGSTVVRTIYPASGTPRLALYQIVGGGHSEPTRGSHYAKWYQRLTGAQNGDIEAVEEIWSFFSAQKP